MKVLLIDDDQAILTVFETVLSKAGFQTITSITGSDGLNKAANEKPDIILCDQILPDISGNAILQQLQASESTKIIPLIILSNFSQQDLVNNAIAAGATDYIFKYQIEPEELVKKVKEVLKMQ